MWFIEITAERMALGCLDTRFSIFDGRSTHPPGTIEEILEPDRASSIQYRVGR
jgi:hypothetical protein